MEKIKRKKGRVAKSIKWKNISIGKKYLLSFLFAAALFVIAGVVVYVQTSTVSDNIVRFEAESKRTEQIARLGSLIQSKDVKIADYIISGSEKFIQEFEIFDNEFNELAEALKLDMRTDQQKDLFMIIQTNSSRMTNLFLNEVVEAVDGENLGVASTLRDNSNQLMSATVERVNELIEIGYIERSEVVASANRSMQNSTIILGVANASAIVLGIMTMFIINRDVTSNLHKVVQITSEVANGNLQVESMNYNGTDEIGTLSKSIDIMKGNIRNILLDVMDATKFLLTNSEGLTKAVHEVNEGSKQIAVMMDEMAVGTEKQASSAADLSENMNLFVEMVHKSEETGEKVTSTSKDVLQFVKEGAHLMDGAVGQMKQIDQIVTEAVEQVTGLEEQSKEISSLVQTIKDIAGQTDLLALNASIEAARAGEYGLGFTVVASEVRNLAEQVTATVVDITQVVNNINKEVTSVVSSLNKGYEEVKEGTEQIERTGNNFVHINSSLSEMVENMLSVSKNLKQIAGRSMNMNEFIEDIAQVSEESAAGVEEAAATVRSTSDTMIEVAKNADHLAELANQLNNEMEIFKLN